VIVTLSTVSTAEVWEAYLDPVVGHEQGGRRPVVIVSTNRLHEIPNALVFVVPCTARNRLVRSHVLVTLSDGIPPRESFAMTEQVRSVSRQRLRKRIGVIDPETLRLIRRRVTWFMELY
jgi:mRNA interferase MazF